jgi:Zn-dependent protease
MITGWRVLGWAKPVPVDPRNLTRRFTQRTGMAMIAGAGPASNLLLSLASIIALAFVIRIFASDLELFFPSQLEQMFFYAIGKPVEQLLSIYDSAIGLVFLISLLGRMIIINIGLAIFNMLPFGPLDGASIMRGFLPWSMVPAFDKAQPTLAIIVLMLFLFGGLRYLFEPVFQIAFRYYIYPLALLLLGG